MNDRLPSGSYQIAARYGDASDAHTQKARTASRQQLDTLLWAAGIALSFMVITALLSDALRVFYIDREALYVVPDDALISLRVSANIWRHGVPYFNPSEAVAANTSLLWPYVNAVLYAVLNIRLAVLAAGLLTLIIAALTLFIVSASIHDNFSRLVFGAVTIFSTSLLEYAPSSWEHIPEMFLVSVSLLTFCRAKSLVDFIQRPHFIVAASLLPLSVWLRPDGIVFCMVPGLVYLYLAVKHRSLRAVAILLAGVGLVGAYFAAQYLLYGSFVPNTYYLKATGGAESIIGGLFYAAKAALDSATPTVALAATVLMVMQWPQLTLGRRLVLATLLAHFAYVILVGGDVFHFGRFFVVVLPIWAFLFSDAVAAARLGPSDQQRRAALACLIAVFTCVAVSQIVYHIRGATMNAARFTFADTDGTPVHSPDQEAQIALAPAIRQILSPSEGDVGLFWLGSLGYYLPEYTIRDFLGKADPHIARMKAKWGPVGHNKWDFLYTLTTYNIPIVPFIEPSDPSTLKATVQRHADFAFFADFYLNDYVRAHYTFVRPTEMCLSTPWGLFIRNDFLARARDFSARRCGR